MRVFVTGATGFVGSAVVQELLGAGHQVLGLTRSESGAAALKAAGAEVHFGSLEDLDSLRSGAATADGVIHTAFNHDFSKFVENCELDRRAIEALGDALEGTDKPLLVTSGVAHLNPGNIGTENDPPATSLPRKSESTAKALFERGINASVVRLAPSVHDRGDHGFVPMLIGIARQHGFACYAGEGQNRWPGVHRQDAARLYRLALERGIPGACYHAIGEEGVPFKQIAEAIGRGLNIPVVSKTPEAAAEYFGWFAMFAGMDSPTSNEITRKALGWEPTGPGLIEDIDNAGYFG